MCLRVCVCLLSSRRCPSPPLGSRCNAAAGGGGVVAGWLAGGGRSPPEGGGEGCLAQHRASLNPKPCSSEPDGRLGSALWAHDGTGSTCGHLSAWQLQLQQPIFVAGSCKRARHDPVPLARVLGPNLQDLWALVGRERAFCFPRGLVTLTKCAALHVRALHAYACRAPHACMCVTLRCMPCGAAVGSATWVFVCVLAGPWVWPAVAGFCALCAARQ